MLERKGRGDTDTERFAVSNKAVRDIVVAAVFAESAKRVDNAASHVQGMELEEVRSAFVIR